MAELSDFIERAAVPRQTDPGAGDWIRHLDLVHLALSTVPYKITAGRLAARAAAALIQRCLPGCGVYCPDDNINLPSSNGYIVALGRADGGRRMALTLLRHDPDASPRSNGRPATRVIGVTIASGDTYGDDLWPSLKIATTGMATRDHRPIGPIHPSDSGDEAFDLIYPSGANNTAITDLIQRLKCRQGFFPSSYARNPLKYLGHWARSPERVLVIAPGMAEVSWMAATLAFAAVMQADAFVLRPDCRLSPWDPRLDYPAQHILEPLVMVRRVMLERFRAALKP
jgi:hypothetical protein